MTVTEQKKKIAEHFQLGDELASEIFDWVGSDDFFETFEIKPTNWRGKEGYTIL